jgi:hypothetical protein
MYLSIDIDFWNKIGTADLMFVLQEVKESKKLVQVCDNHKHLLKSVGSSGCDEIVNVDTHSDIMTADDVVACEARGHKVNCGNWLNHVKWQQRGTIKWVSPKDHWSRCDGRMAGGVSPFKKPESIGWTDISQEEVKAFPLDLIEKATVIGISVSYYYLNHHLKKGIVQAIFKEYLGKVPPQREFSNW